MEDVDLSNDQTRPVSGRGNANTQPSYAAGGGGYTNQQTNNSAVDNNSTVATNTQRQDTVQNAPPSAPRQTTVDAAQRNTNTAADTASQPSKTAPTNNTVDATQPAQTRYTAGQTSTPSDGVKKSNNRGLRT